MRTNPALLRKPLVGYCSVFLLSFALYSVPAAGGERTLYSFREGSDGLWPNSALATNDSRDLYGTTAGGSDGTVFKLTPDGKESVLHEFTGYPDGARPVGTLILDGSGNVYGVTNQGGTADDGVVYRLARGGAETLLYDFQGGSDGAAPLGGLIMDDQGNLYGTTEFGGSSNCEREGCGTVFEIASTGNESVLYAFQGGDDGVGPWGSLLRDSNGNLIGATSAGGSGSDCDTYGCGTIFEVAAGGAKSILHNFQLSEGLEPNGNLVMDQAGNLYGTAVGGGAEDLGTVFELGADGTLSVIYSFKGGSDGADPYGGVIMDDKGNLFGTTTSGGGTHCKSGCGTVFEVTSKAEEKILYSFQSFHGRDPLAGLLLGAHHELFGTANVGGAHNDGVVFEVNK